MQFYSAPNQAFPGVLADDGGAPPELVAELSEVGLIPVFEEFVACVRDRAAAGDSLSTAMLLYCINGIMFSTASSSLPDDTTLRQSIMNRYAFLNTPGKIDQLVDFSLYLYVTLQHFSAWYARGKKSEVFAVGSSQLKVLKPGIREYVRKALEGKPYAGGVTIDPAFFDTDEFKAAFTIDGTLLEMLGPTRLGRVIEKNFLRPYDYLRSSGTRIRKGKARAVKREFAQAFRSLISGLISTDVRRCLAKLNTPPSAIGLALASGYGDYRQFGVGNGTGTTAMFGVTNFGLIFFEYELTGSDDSQPCSANILNLPVLDAADEDGTAVSVFYYGLDNDFSSDPKRPVIEVCTRTGTKAPDATFSLQVNLPGAHSPATPLSPPPPRGTPLINQIKPNAIGLGTFTPKPDSISLNLKSSAEDNPEELIYIVFKHRIIPAGTNLTIEVKKRQKQIHLDTSWLLPDNQFRKTPQEVQAEVFAGQASQLSALAAALAADPAFEVYSSIEGQGVGRILDWPREGTGGLGAERDDDQADRPLPAKADYDLLRYAHGRLEWYPGTLADPAGWLIFYVNGFVSPLRCTWEEKMPAAEAQILKSAIKPYCMRDSQTRASYNCILSAFRAFGLFESMVEMLKLEAFGGPDFNRIKTALDTHVSTDARASALLPNGRGPILFKQSDIAPFT